eukprot:14135890-Alexandrium_andersonii.AAC.1
MRQTARAAPPSPWARCSSLAPSWFQAPCTCYIPSRRKSPTACRTSRPSWQTYIWSSTYLRTNGCEIASRRRV